MVEFVLYGKNIKSPKGWSNARVNAIFKQRSQPDITVTEFLFEKEATAIIDLWILNNGYFRGCPFIIKTESVVFFDGYLDFSRKFIKIHEGKYLVGVTKRKGLNELADKIEGYTMGLLAERRAANGTPLTTIDIPYIVDKKYSTLEGALLIITSFLLLREIEASLNRAQKLYNDGVGVSTETPPQPPGLGDWLKLALNILLEVAYTILIANALQNLVNEIINEIYPDTKYNKGFLIKDHLEAFVEDAGFNGIEFGWDMSNEYYFPSKGEDERNTGIPNASDYGYLMSEMFAFLKDAYYADVSVDNNGVVQVRSEGDSYFRKNSNYVMPDINLESVEYNIDELKGTKVISFLTDVTDEWTIDNYKGTSYEIHTNTKTNNGEQIIKGLEQINLNVALGNRKDTFTFLEKRIKEMAQLSDFVINSLGGNSSLSSRVKKRYNLIKVGAESWNLPKIMRLNSSLGLDANHRDIWSAKYLYDNYHSYGSFMIGDNTRQRKIYKDVTIPMCMTDFESLINNAYFTTNNGNLGKFTKLQYGIDTNNAIASYWVQEVYDTNLKETFIEP